MCPSHVGMPEDLLQPGFQLRAHLRLVWLSVLMKLSLFPTRLHVCIVGTRRSAHVGQVPYQLSSPHNQVGAPQSSKLGTAIWLDTTLPCRGGASPIRPKRLEQIVCPSLLLLVRSYKVHRLPRLTSPFTSGLRRSHAVVC